MEYKIYFGKPVNLNNRLQKEINTYYFLESNKIDFWQMDHKPAETMKDCDEIDKMLDVVMCKNLFLCNRQKTEFYLLMMPGSKAFKTKELSSQLGIARLSFADAEHMEEYLNILPGAVSVMGLMNDKENHVRLLIDNDLLKDRYIGCHPCVNTSSIKIKTKDILEHFLPITNHDYTVVNL